MVVKWKRTRDYVWALLVISFPHNIDSTTGVVVLICSLFRAPVSVVSLFSTPMAYHRNRLQVGTSSLAVLGLVTSPLTLSTFCIARSIMVHPTSVTHWSGSSIAWVSIRCGNISPSDFLSTVLLVVVLVSVLLEILIVVAVVVVAGIVVVVWVVVAVRVVVVVRIVVVVSSIIILPLVVIAALSLATLDFPF